MAKTRLRRRGLNDAARVNVLRLNADATGFTVVRHVLLTEALSRIARREWSARWYESGELAGVLLTPPETRAGDLVHIRCGSVECLKGWVFVKSGRAKTKTPGSSSGQTFLRVFVNFLDADSGQRLRGVSAELALKKIDLGQWKAIWSESGELAGVAAV